MTIIFVLSISYSYGEGMEFIGKGIRADPTGEPGKYEFYDVDPDKGQSTTLKGQSTTTPATGYDASSGSSRSTSMSMCKTLERDWENDKLKMASIKSAALKKVKNLKKSFKFYYDKSKRDFTEEYKRTILPRARKQKKSNAWIRKDYNRRWNRKRDKRLERYYKAREAIYERARSKAVAKGKEMRIIKKEYNETYNCKSEKSPYR